MQANCFSVAAAPAARSAAVAANNSVRVCPSPLPTRSQNASYVAFYSAATIFVMPMYGMMLAAPRWHVTIKLMQSPAIFLAYGALYTVLLVQSWKADTLALMFSARGSALPELTSIAEMFLRPASAAAYWVHLLSLDLFMARHVYLDGIRSGSPSRLSLVLCMMFGPLGLVAHLATKALRGDGVSLNPQQRIREEQGDAAKGAEAAAAGPSSSTSSGRGGVAHIGAAAAATKGLSLRSWLRDRLGLTRGAAVGADGARVVTVGSADDAGQQPGERGGHQ